MRPVKRLLITTTLLLLLVPTLFCGWLMSSGSGLRWLLTKVTLPDTLEIDAIEGSLISGLRLSGVRYHDGKVKITLGEALLDWRPAALWQGELRAEMLYLQRLRIELPPSDGTPLQLPDIRLPVTVQLDDMQVNDLEIVRPEWPAIRINNASLRGKANRGGVMVQYLNVSSDVAQFALHGTLHPYGDYWHNLELQWQLQLAGLPTLNGSGQLKGDLRQTTLQHRLTLPLRATTELKLLDLLQQPHWQAALQIPRQPLTAVYETWPDEEVALTARGSGDLRHATIDDFTLDALKSRAHGKGALDWQERFQWQADVESRRFDLPALWSLLKVQGAPMIGVNVKAKLNGDLDQLVINDATLHALDGAIRGNGEVRWRDRLQWRTRLQATQLELTQLWPLLALDGHGLPAGRAGLTTALSGDASGLDFTQLTLRALGATVRGDVALQWQPQLQWQTSLTGEGLDPAVWQPQRFAAWPGNLATQLENRGSYVNQQLEGDLNIKRLDGTLRGYPIALQTELAQRPRQLEIKTFNLSSAESRVVADGIIGEQMALRLQLDSPQLAQLHPDVSGALKLSGQLSGARAEPLLQLELDGKKVGYAGQLVGSVQGNAAVQLFSWQQILVDLYGRDLQLGGQAIDTLEFHARGDAADNQLKLQLGMEKLEALWRLNGAFDTERQQWQGEIRVADMNNPELGLWQLRNPARLTAALDAVTLEPLCWYQQAAELCIEGGHQQQQWQGELNGRDLGLALLSPWLPRDLELTGTATLHATAHYQPQQPALAATARIDVGAGNVSYPLLENERNEWRFTAGQWQGTLDSSGLRSQLQLALTGADSISATLELPDYDPLTTKLAGQPLKGEVNAAFGDLGLLNNLLYEAQGLQGRIELSSQIGGSVAQPALTGRLQLRDGRLQIPRLGLSLSEVEFDASSAGNEQVEYRLKVRSGEGSITARGQTRLDPQQGWPTQLTLSGEQFEASHIPEARIVINPRLELKMARREIWLNGEIAVPEAQLQPKEFTSAASISDDVVIVGAPESAARPWQLHNRVRLILGERVALHGFGFEGTIGGNLLLIDEPGKPTAASGELNVVEGRYRAYGQHLDVEQGRLLFAGGPITNPALDLRAVRHIQEVTAGIKVYGLLRQPQFELFSVPAMDQTDALAYLVLGAPLEQTTSKSDGAVMAQAALALGLKGGDLLARSIGNRFGIEEMRIESTGKGEQASLVMGRYLSPRLYVGYGVGLVDAANTFNLRYQLSERWQLKAESGISQSADVIYSIEK